MKPTSAFALLIALSLSVLSAATITPAASKPNGVVLPGDDTIPHVVDGGLWKTSFKFVNLENHSVTFTLYFFKDDGSPMLLPINGTPLIAPGNYSAITFVMSAAESTTIQTSGVATNLTSGWAYMDQANLLDSIGGFAIFRQHIPGGQDQEATVPLVSELFGHFVMLYDNSTFITGVAVSNPSNLTISIPVNIHSETGAIIDRQTITLPPFGHTAFALSDKWPSTSGNSGVIEFLSTQSSVAAVGLRFNGSAFTTFEILANPNWLPQ